MTIDKKEKPTIEFEGKIVKPNKQGKYYCPFKCGQEGYPQPSWKTEKGFRGHMIKCSKRPSLAKINSDKKNEQIEKNEEKINQFLSIHPIGSTIFISSHRVTKPTHVQRGNRMVKVRYEEERRYFAAEIEIKRITPNSYSYPEFQLNYQYWNDVFKIHETMKEAESSAEKNNKSYKKGCDFASMCR